MSNAPAHAPQHHELIQLLAKVIESYDLINGVIIVTVGHDGRPMVGGNMESPEHILGVLARVAGAGDDIASVTKVETPRDN